ncbi:MAG: cation:proton antiporter, partial [Actinobacteria bacterium]|nr:cation:proton antiporter [Actinomycetota bacterium]
MLLEELFFEIGAIIVVAAFLAMAISRLRLPLVIAYIVTGILVGPSVFALASRPEIFDAFSKIGVAFLLFTVGLGLNWRNVRDVGGIALATGFGQVVATSLVGFAIGRAIGFDPVTSLYVAVAFSFSSTIIIVKLLSDKDELDTLYGRISVGFLLVQDFIAMFILLGLGTFGSGASVTDIVTQTLLKIGLLVPLLWAVSKFLVPRLVAFAAKSQELLFVFSIAWCFL